MARGSFISSEKSRKVFTPPNNSSISSGGESELSKEEKLIRYEKYNPTGDFAKDFAELCFFLGLDVQVGVRSKIPSSSQPESRCETRTIKGDKKQAISNCSSKDTDKDFQTDEIPMTYTLAENDEKCFQARVEVESVKDAHKESIKGLYVRNLRANTNVIDVLSRTISHLEQLSVLDMWNVGLNDDMLIRLRKCLVSSPSLKTLSLDGNTNVSSQRFGIFLRDSGKANLQNLSLRSCNLNETGAFHLSDSLTNNESLLTLNLCCNKLGNSGARHLATSLRTNRTLLSLNLSANNICDEGVKDISDAISTFPLTHDQVVAKRFKMSTLNGDKFIPNEEKLNVELPRPRERRASLSSGSPGGKKDKPVIKKRETPPKSRESVHKRDRPVSTLKTKMQRQELVIKVEGTPTELENGYEFPNPLLEKARIENGEHWIPGNRSLINLNLSRNKISASGLKFLHDAVNFQFEHARETQRQKGVGLLRISLKGNSFSLDDSTYMALNELLKIRDPISNQSVNDTITEQVS